MQKWTLLLLINLFAWHTQAQHKKRILFYDLDVIHGLYYQPNTIKPYTGTAYDKFPNKKKRMTMPIKNGKIEGTVKEWLENGQIILERHFKDGVPHGKETQWFVIGKKKVEVNYVNGKVEGIAKEWYKSGQLKSEGLFRNGKEEGEHKWWHINGQIDQIVFYKNGLAEGTVKNWFADGSLQLESNFKNGLKNGITKKWSKNGQKIFEGTYREDKKDGKFYTWMKNGQLLTEDKYDFGKLIESKNYSSGSVFVGDGYVEVFNGLSDFFKIKITGNQVKNRRAKVITYVVDGDLLQLFNYSASKYLGEYFSQKTEKELLNIFVEKEAQFIRTATNFDIEVKKEMGKTPKGKNYVYWHFASPSSKDAEQKPRTVQEEHYISFICGGRILSLYGVVTNNDKPQEVKIMLQRIADSLEIKKERIDLNSIVSSIH